MKKYTQICQIAEDIKVGTLPIGLIHKHVTPYLQLDEGALADLNQLVTNNPHGKLRDAFYFTIVLENPVKDADLIESINSLHAVTPEDQLN